MMQPESQAILREFNRRLRAALHEAPNHVRVEAALEVESHVLDVLNRSAGKEAEPELVARVLSGFGSPEEYARALLSQVPGDEAATVGSGFREVALAASDLLRGMWRLVRALASRGAAFLALTLQFLWRISLAAWRRGGQAVAQARGPAGRLVRWLQINAAAALYGLRRLGRRLMAGGIESAGRMIRWGESGAHGAVALSGRMVRGGSVLVGLLGRLLRWTLRAAGVALITFLAVASLGLAGFAALAPDITGWFVRGIQSSVRESLNELRSQTVNGIYFGSQSDLVQVGTTVFTITLSLGLLLVGLLVYLSWTARRRRRTATGH